MLLPARLRPRRTPRAVGRVVSSGGWRAGWRALTRREDGNGVLEASDLAVLMNSIGRRLSEAELSEMIDKANPEQQGNAALKLDDFLALMAQASGITRCCGMPDPRATPY
jgi:hypothetical protein